MTEYSTYHCKCFGHKESMTRYAGLKTTSKQGSVIANVDSNHSKVVKEN